MTKKQTEVMTVSPELQRNIDALQAFKAQVDIIGSNCQQITIVDETSLAVGQQNLSKANNLLTSIEEKRAIIKAPYWDAGKLINSTAKTLSEELIKGIKHIKDQVAEWEKKRIAEAAAKQTEIDRQLAEKKALDDAEENRKYIIRTHISDKAAPLLKKMYSECTTIEICDKHLESISKNYKTEDFFQEFWQEAKELRDNYVELIRNKRIQLADASTMSEAEIELALKAEKLAVERANLEMAQRELEAEKERLMAEKEAKEAELAAEAEKLRLAEEAEANKTRGIRKNWKVELVDSAKLPSEWIILNESAAKEYRKENADSIKNGDIINGVKFYQEISVSA